MLTVLGMLLTLSVLSPWEIGTAGQPLETPEGIKPEWYFLPTYQLLKYFSGERAKVVGIFVGNIPFLLLFLWPFLERGKQRHPRHRPVATTIGILGVVLGLGFGTLGPSVRDPADDPGPYDRVRYLGRPSILPPQSGGGWAGRR